MKITGARRSLRVLTAAVVTATALAACSSGSNAASGGGSGSGGSGGSGGDMTFAVIPHSDGSDNFFPVLKNGADAAGKEVGAKINYTYAIDPLKQAQLIDNAAAQHVSGIITTLPNADALGPSLKKAEAAGIPVITMNSGAQQSASVGALAHVGQDELVAGRGAGERLKAAGVKNLICLIHEPGNVALQQRCQGISQTFGGTVTPLQVNISNLPSVTAAVSAKLQADKSIDGLIALNPGVATAAQKGIKDAGSSAKLATFDLSKDVISAINSGDILFAIDQQQYLQGYLPVIMMSLYLQNGNTVGGGQPVLTGPGFVTKDNASQVADLTGKGTR